MNKPSGINVLWFKRDLRLRDHEPLKAAIEAGQQSGRPLLLLYCFEPSVMADPNYAMRHWRFVYESLTDLNGQLMDLPITYTAPVYLFQREVIDVLTALHRQFTIHTLYSHQETGLRITYDRDKIVARFCQQHRLDWREYESNAVRRGLKTGVGVQANWDRTMQQCQQQPDLTRWQPVRLLANWYEVERGPALPDDWQQTDPQFQPGGERNAHRYMTSFFAQRIAQYENSISKPLESRRGGSRLSPYLAWGCLSARQVYEVLLTNSRKTALVNYVFSFGFLKGRKPLTPRSGFVLKEYFPNRLIWANGAGEINSKSFSSIGYPSWCNSLIISCI
ncbi:deoxyribodipyrimidine photo-lyase [Rudanella lutea]|uniref:deoxyribodipyrimidine photo-lyase n=1 Tax=Rudanella lutea TaxID=451374 RepID=UPI001FE14A8A|nr:deoxyribodipyrimidine photo-lyase [Rudanella lutea]